MIPTNLIACFQQGSKSFGWQEHGSELASMHKGEWREAMGKGGVFLKSYKSGEEMGAVLFSEGYLLIYGSEAILYPGCEAHISKIATDVFDLKPEHIFIASHKKEITEASAERVFNHSKKQHWLIDEVMKTLQQKIKQVAVTGFRNIFTKNSPDELIISKGFLKHHSGNAKIPILDILRKNNLSSLQAFSNAENDQQTKAPDSFTCVVQYVAIKINGDTGKLMVNKLVTVMDAGRIDDLATMAAHLKNTLNFKLDQIEAAAPIARKSGINHSGSIESAIHSILGEIPSIEIIFLNPAAANDKRPIADAHTLTTIYLDCFSNALHNAIEQATGIHYSSSNVANNILGTNSKKKYLLSKPASSRF